MTATTRVSWFVPGRIEILGKHTDYAGGRSLLAAVDCGHTVTATTVSEGDEAAPSAQPNATTLAPSPRIITATSASAPDVVTVDLDHPDKNAESTPGQGLWSGYVQAVVKRLDANFPGMISSAQLHVQSDLPLAAGMSSSSALIVGLALSLIDLFGLREHPAFQQAITGLESLAEYCGCIENGQSYGALAGHRGVGTFGGSEDHTAMLCGQNAALVQYSFCPIKHEATIPFPNDLALVVGVSGVSAEKTGAAMGLYNQASLATQDLLDHWQRATGRADATLAAAVRADDQAADRLAALVSDRDDLTRRMRQFVSESEHLVPAAAQALRAGDLDEFGRLVDQSQRYAEDDLGNQVPQTIRMQRLARDLGAIAASAFGAGFGGSVWAMVPSSDAEDFAQRWMSAYATEFPTEAKASSVLVTRPGPPAHRVL
ncbi:galactokinase family protein [Devriesea agamarum]|uniref:galactokinase family protein n=1 Tax=Devriesea agamarum TaxID=472569 RepID=UPI00071CA940|nr:galactokinase family protein [Devriesea agamarum]